MIRLLAPLATGFGVTAALVTERPGHVECLLQGKAEIMGDLVAGVCCAALILGLVLLREVKPS